MQATRKKHASSFLTDNESRNSIFEAASKRPLKGNIYLAKVTRVEPSLQAAFVEYGGNRQGFLAFSEIHPTTIRSRSPTASPCSPSRKPMPVRAKRRHRVLRYLDQEEVGKPASLPQTENGEDEPNGEETGGEETGGEETGEAEDNGAPENNEGDNGSDEPASADETAEDGAPANGEAAAVEPVDGEAAPVEGEPVPEGEERPAPKGQDAQALDNKRPSQRWMKRRHYKIQEVIKRRRSSSSKSSRKSAATRAQR